MCRSVQVVVLSCALGATWAFAQTPDRELLRAAALGSVGDTTAALEAEADPNVSDARGMTPLMLAARLGHVEVVQALLGEGADPEAEDAAGRTSRDWSAGRSEVLEHFRAASPPSDPPTGGPGVTELGELLERYSPEYPADARRAGVVGVVRLEGVISPEGDVASLRVMCGHPLLIQSAMSAVRRWKYRPYVRNGQPVPVTTTVVLNFNMSTGPVPSPASGCPGLPDVAATGNDSWVRDLIEAGIDVDMRGGGGTTAVYVAAVRGREEIVRRLLESGARHYLMADNGTTALIAASLSGQAETVEELLLGGAEVDLATDAGVTALMAAAQEGHEEIVRRLLESDADPRAQTTSGATALSTASANGHAAIVRILAEAMSAP